MKTIFTLMSITIFMSGCATFSGAENANNIARLKYGMGESQVLSILGTPDSITHPSSVQDQWIYEFKKQDKRGQNMFVEFRDGLLVKSGKLNGREIAAANETRTPGVCTHRVHPEVQQESLCIK